MKTFQCSACGAGVFFDNTHCVQCGATLAYVAAARQMAAFEPNLAGGFWPVLGSPAQAIRQGKWRPCENYRTARICNWMVAVDDPQPLCACCRQTEVIPGLVRQGNREAWAALEAAKRRLCYTLDSLALDRPGLAEDPVHGLRFHFLEEVGPDDEVLTGHDSGLIVLNIAEADDAEREARRTAMGEPYRTLLGHFRHETGHFYWDRLVAGGPWLEACRAMFGEETVNYGESLQWHYQNGPPADWATRYISAYASCHPWEDWAETWAHYLHLIDGLETARHWQAELARGEGLPAGSEAPAGATQPFREQLLRDWLPLSRFLNSVNRSLGQRDGYPFVLPDAVLDKLEFVHRVVGSAAGKPWPMWPPAAAVQ